MIQGVHIGALLQFAGDGLPPRHQRDNAGAAIVVDKPAFHVTALGLNKCWVLDMHATCCCEHIVLLVVLQHDELHSILCKCFSCR